ncbi:putative pectinesterase/pectinesterase inhibitor 45 [Humulus lupulus]|uniref:putative pectinesterase/pectinesterase inhibitor 45 n=1 Tax=Humulus lupulus TaxID=3486 RepID=UPI002B401365|nr:putative pectinesterase/pectinesterase inhibitor 45 [Humulus lupulus]
MAFQDFDEITERRRAAREQSFRKRVITGVVTGFILLAIIAAGAAAFVVVSRAEHHTHGAPSSSSTSSAHENKREPTVSESEHRVVKLICNATDYKDKCENALMLGLKNYSSGLSRHRPEGYLKTAILSAKDELHRAFNKTKSFKFSNPDEEKAFADCEVLMEDAMEELEASISTVKENNILNKTPLLKSWLSAVISYQQTCIDGFPEGKMKTDMTKLFKASKEFTSNSLALISEVTSLLSTYQTVSTARNLQEKEKNSPASLDRDGFPNWIGHEDRRVLKVKGDLPTPNVTVAKDGTGDFTTINDALAAIPSKYQGRYVIYIKEGIYEETVVVTKKMVNVTIYGDGSQKSIITGSKNFVDGVRTFQTATFVVLGEGFMGKAMGFRNTAGPEKHQAVAARVQADRAIFANCRFEGYQDTLYTQAHRQFYRSCVIAGTIDFIFGDAAVVFQNCMLVVRMPMANQKNIVTAQGRVDKQQTTGIVIHNCRIMADKKLEPEKASVKSFLGRPWKEYSRTIVMESTIEDLIHPDGWLPWEGEFALKTLYYAEYNNKGPGAKVTTRVNWPGYSVINKKEAEKFTVENFLQGNDWLNIKGIPVRYTLYT